jgi:hypothetical protein
VGCAGVVGVGADGSGGAGDGAGAVAAGAAVSDGWWVVGDVGGAGVAVG